MRTRRFLAVVCAAVLGALVLVAPAAQAGGEYEAIRADLDGDGTIDVAILGASGDRCAVSIQWAGVGTPVVHRYLPPNAAVPVIFCPDLGAAIDLGGDGTIELVVGWFARPESAIGYDLLVLRNFVPDSVYQAASFLNAIDTADFNGDRLDDIYVWTNEGDGFITLLNTSSGQLVPGPIQLANVEVEGVDLADFDGNGAMDVVVGYTTGMGVPLCGVVVLFDDGSRVWLQADDECDQHWAATVVDANQDGRPDARTWEWRGDVTTFINRGDRTFVAAPVANDDVASVRWLLPKVINVRANDDASSFATLTIIKQPRYGRLIKDRRHEVVYLRTAPHALPDTFVYRISEEGHSATATVTVRVRR